MSKEKPTLDELLNQAKSLGDKIEYGVNDLKKEVSKLSDTEKLKVLEDKSFSNLKDSLKGLAGDLDNLDKNQNKDE
jgi:hypothetical protein